MPRTSKTNGKQPPQSNSRGTSTRGTNKNEIFMNSNVNAEFLELFIRDLRTMYDGELQLIDALPKVAKAATSQDLKDAITNHLRETKNQADRLKKIFTILRVEVKGVTSPSMKEMIRDVNTIMSEISIPEVRDAAIIAAAQFIEHWEIAGYGTLKTYAKQLGYDEIADLLKDSLSEESQADQSLTNLAEGSFFTTGINQMACTCA